MLPPPARTPYWHARATSHTASSAASVRLTLQQRADGVRSASIGAVRVLAIALLCLLLPGAGRARAQLTEASLSGTISDATSQVIPFATVAVSHEDTGQRRTVTCDRLGAFTISGLPPGVYSLTAASGGFQSVTRTGLRLPVGRTSLTIQLQIEGFSETVAVSANAVQISTSHEARLSNTFGGSEIQDLPLPQRDIFALTKLSAGATLVPGAANSTKLSSSPVITVNGNRYRGNNYVLDGAMNSNPNNSGEPSIVPSVEAVEAVEVQTLNFASEFGRGNGAVINVRTRSGANHLTGRTWEYHRGDALNARNYFAATKPAQNFNQFGANLGGPIRKDRTFFFVNYEGTRDNITRPYTFQVETPEFRDYVSATAPGNVAARLLQQFPAPTPQTSGTPGQKYLDQQNMAIPGGSIPALGRVAVNLADHTRFDQVLARLDHTLTSSDRLSARWVGDFQRDEGGSSSSQATLGRAVRGERGPFSGYFANLNVGHMHVRTHTVNDVRVSWQTSRATRGDAAATVPTITVTGLTAPFGDVFLGTTELGTLEVRNVLTMDRGSHTLRVGAEGRRITKGLSIGPASSGTFAFNSMADFAADKPFRQTLTVAPNTGNPTGFPRYFTQYETGAFIQDQWALNSHVSLSLGLRHDYFGTVSERNGLLSSVILGPGATFREQVANATVGRVTRLYDPERLNFSPRVGLAWDPTGTGRTSMRTGYSRAYQPHHGQSISGARALPPDALQGVIQPSAGLGTQILYDIPVPYNPQFGRGLNAQGGVISNPGEPAIRTTGFVVNPVIKTQYTESWFANAQHRIGAHWMAEAGYVGTRGVDLERIDDVNRVSGDLLDGRLDRLNRNFDVLLFVTNGVSSRYDALTVELRRELSRGFSVTGNYRWSKWVDTGSDTSTGQFQDVSEPGKGAQEIACLACEKGRSMFDVPHRLSFSGLWMAGDFAGRGRLAGALARHWQLSAVLTAQSGRPFSVWNGASFAAGGDYNADGGGGAVGGGFYDRPNAPPAGTPTTFTTAQFLSGIFPASLFPKPAPGTDGTLGRNTFRGPRYVSLDMSLTRNFRMGGTRSLQLRADVYNALNNLNLFLPNVDLSVSNFGRSTQAFDARVTQVGLRVLF